MEELYFIDPVTFEFFKTSALICVGIGLLLNWGALVRSFKSNDTPEYGPIAGIALWALLVPPSLYWWIWGLPQKPLHLGGVALSTLVLIGSVSIITVQGWRESKTPWIRRVVPAHEIDCPVAIWKGRAAALALLLACWFLMASIKEILRIKH